MNASDEQDVVKEGYLWKRGVYIFESATPDDRKKDKILIFEVSCDICLEVFETKLLTIIKVVNTL